MRSFLGFAQSSDEHDDHYAVSMARNKVSSAFFYGIASILVIFSNKAILTEYHFPYFKFVAFVQFVTTSIVLYVLSVCKKVDVPPLSLSIFKEIMPISLMFLGNVLCGLGSTKALSIPMFTALRRFSILLTMLGEWLYLSSRPSTEVVFSVALMVGGAFIAALYDLSYDTAGYVLVFFNNIFTALNGVWMKRASISGKCSKMGVLYYNSLFSAVIMFLYFSGEHFYYLQSSSNSSGGSSNSVSGAVHLRAIAQSEAVATAMHWPERMMHSVDGFLLPHPLHQQLQQTQQQQQQRQPHDVATDAAAADASESSQEIASAVSAVRRMLLLGYVAVISPTDGAATSSSSNSINSNGVTQNIGSSSGSKGIDISSNSNSNRNSHYIAAATTSSCSTLTLVSRYSDWWRWDFLLMLMLACFMGSILNYSIFLCTTYNSALTTAVVGTLKNVLTTYMGMMMFNDYTFTAVNFAGINISIAGSLYYTYCTMMRRKVATRSSELQLQIASSSAGASAAAVVADCYAIEGEKSSPPPKTRTFDRAAQKL